MGYLIGFIEMMFNVILYEGIFNKSIKNVFKHVIIVLVCSMFLTRYRYINALFVYTLIFFIQSILIAKVDKKSNMLLMSEMMISIIIGCTIQFISVVMFYFVTGKLTGYLWANRIITAIVLGGVIFLINKIAKRLNVNLEEVVESNIDKNNIVINIFILFIVFKSVISSKNVEKGVILEVLMLVAINIILNVIFYKARFDKYMKSKEIQVKNTYNPLIGEIIDNIRANEHEYKNHLNIIYSMIQISKDIEEVKEKAKNYIGDLENVSILNSVIRIDNTIVKAVIYNKLIECEQHGIKLKYSIIGDIDNLLLDDTELTIVLSNLLNNAIEATKEIDQKNIELSIINDDEGFEVETKNNVDQLVFKEIEVESLFKKGISSKGNGRGYGLYNVKKIVGKHKGEMFSNLDDGMLTITVAI